MPEQVYGSIIIQWSIIPWYGRAEAVDALKNQCLGYVELKYYFEK